MKLDDTIELKVKAKLICDPDGSVGSKFYMKTEGFSATIADMEQDLGTISGCMGGGIELADSTRKNCIWYIAPQDLWIAYQEAMKLQEK